MKKKGTVERADCPRKNSLPELGILASEPLRSDSDGQKG